MSFLSAVSEVNRLYADYFANIGDPKPIKEKMASLTSDINSYKFTVLKACIATTLEYDLIEQSLIISHVLHAFKRKLHMIIAELHKERALPSSDKAKPILKKHEGCVTFMAVFLSKMDMELVYFSMREIILLKEIVGAGLLMNDEFRKFHNKLTQYLGTKLIPTLE
jgi:hypothetical protein